MSIAVNRQASYHYFLEDRFEAGLVLQGWEVKAIRAGRVQLTDGYVIIREGGLYLIGCQVTPLTSASTHMRTDAARTKKLLLHAHEIRLLIGKVERKGYTLIPLDLHYSKGKIKLQIALARGKKLHDKRDDVSKRDWQRQQQRLLKNQLKR